MSPAAARRQHVAHILLRREWDKVTGFEYGSREHVNAIANHCLRVYVPGCYLHELAREHLGLAAGFVAMLP